MGRHLVLGREMALASEWSYQQTTPSADGRFLWQVIHSKHRSRTSSPRTTLSTISGATVKTRTPLFHSQKCGLSFRRELLSKNKQGRKIWIPHENMPTFHWNWLFRSFSLFSALVSALLHMSAIISHRNTMGDSFVTALFSFGNHAGFWKMQFWNVTKWQGWGGENKLLEIFIVFIY